MARSDPQVNIRMPQPLKDRLESAAEAAKRSLNGEIVERLERSFDGPVEQSGVDRLLKKLNERDDKAAKLQAQDRLLSLSAILMRFLVEKLPPRDKLAADKMTALAHDYSSCLLREDLLSATYKAVELIEIGVRAGVFQSGAEADAALASSHESLEEKTKP